MNTKEIVKKYLAIFFSGQPDLDKIRAMLADNFTFQGPLMTANSADIYIAQLKAMGPLKMAVNIHQILSNDNQAAASYDFVTPRGNVPAVEWYWLENKKILRMKLHLDPRPFLTESVFQK